MIKYSITVYFTNLEKITFIDHFVVANFGVLEDLNLQKNKSNSYSFK